MKQQLYQKLLDKMVTNRYDHDTLQALLAKYVILKDGGDRAASVQRELTNS